MTLKHLQNLASLHGISHGNFASMPKTPTAFLHACNMHFARLATDDTGKRADERWQIATGKRTMGQVRRAKQKVKVVVTPNRQALINHFWRPLAMRLREYVTTTKGGTKHAAEFIGTHAAQIHRWTCPVCEHDQEPSYSLGKAVEIFLSTLE